MNRIYKKSFQFKNVCIESHKQFIESLVKNVLKLKSNDEQQSKQQRCFMSREEYIKNVKQEMHEYLRMFKCNKRKI